MKKYIRIIYSNLFKYDRYLKFVIITRSRTGSNLLVSYLNSHEQINCQGELYSQLGDRTSQAIWLSCFKKLPKRIKAVGFKLFYYHPNDSSDTYVWDQIQSDKNIKIIHLTRDNLLRVLVSRQIASKLNYWSNKGQGNEPSLKDKRISLSFEECLEDFKSTKEYELSIEQRFPGHKVYNLQYEQLIANPQVAMNGVLDFIGLRSTRVKSSFKKQNPENLDQVIENFEKLSEQLRNSEWAYLLDLQDSN